MQTLIQGMETRGEDEFKRNFYI